MFAINDEQHKDCLKIGETTLEEDCTNILPPNDTLLNEAAHKLPHSKEKLNHLRDLYLCMEAMAVSPTFRETRLKRTEIG